MLMLWELLFFLRKSLQFYQMLCIIYLLFTDGFPSGQRGQTVNLLAPPSKVRILLHPANLALTSLRCRSYFFVQKENRKGAAKPRPLCTPLGLFFSSARDSLFLFVDLCLYASVFSALRCADVVLFLHFLCGSLSARCLYSSLLSAPCCADVVLFLHFLCGSLLARCLYSSLLSAPCYADIILFLHFLCGSLLARCLYSSILSALRVAISRFESQARGGRLLVVTLAEPPSAR